MLKYFFLICCGFLVQSQNVSAYDFTNFSNNRLGRASSTRALGNLGWLFQTLAPRPLVSTPINTFSSDLDDLSDLESFSDDGEDPTLAEIIGKKIKEQNPSAPNPIISFTAPRMLGCSKLEITSTTALGLSSIFPLLMECGNNSLKLKMVFTLANLTDILNNCRAATLILDGEFMGEFREVEFPEQVTNQHLRSLHLHNFNISWIPSFVYSLELLTSLNIELNGGKSLGSLSKLKNLEELYVTDANLPMFPAEIYALEKLRILSLKGCALREFPDLHKLKSLRSLTLENNLICEINERVIDPSSHVERILLRKNPIALVSRKILELANLLHIELYLKYLDLVSAQPNCMGGFDLRYHFPNSILSVQVPKIRKAQADTFLNGERLIVNRDLLRDIKVALVPETSAVSYEEAVRYLHKIRKSFVFDPNRPSETNYFHYSYLVPRGKIDSIKYNLETDNEAICRKYVVLPLVQRMRMIWGVPRETDINLEAYRMYSEQLPEMKQTLSHVLKSIFELENVSDRVSLFMQLYTGLVECQAGQKEALDAVCLALLSRNQTYSQTELNYHDFDRPIRRMMGIEKHRLVTQTLLWGGNSNNSHNSNGVSYYKDRLKDSLGLSYSISSFQDRLGIVLAAKEKDPFHYNPALAYLFFYRYHFTVDFLMKKIQEMIESPEDQVISAKIGVLDSLLQKPVTQNLLKNTLESRALNLTKKISRYQEIMSSRAERELLVALKGNRLQSEDPSVSEVVDFVDFDLDQSKVCLAALNRQISAFEGNAGAGEPQTSSHKRGRNEDEGGSNKRPRGPESFATTYRMKVQRLPHAILKEKLTKKKGKLEEGRKDRPLSIGTIVDRLHVGEFDSSPLWYERYFSCDPTVEDNTAALSAKGLENLLVDLKYLLLGEDQPATPQGR